jgi:hypothetical protein
MPSAAQASGLREWVQGQALAAVALMSVNLALECPRKNESLHPQ